MTKIDFYILKENTSLNCDLLACRIIEKAYKQQHKVYLHTASEQDAQRLDDLLWTFNQGSFIPHQVLAANQRPQSAPIMIGYNEPGVTNTQLTDHDVLVNMTSQVPDIFSRFCRVAELVGTDSTEKSQARERFKFYRDRGYQLDSHDIK